MKIKFLGAAKTVTGSSFLVETSQTKFLVDAGMFQGEEVENLNYLKYDFDPKTIDFLILTHAHIDHSGLIPKLVRNGFRGKIYATIPTVRLASILLFDSAKIQEHEMKRRKVNLANRESVIVEIEPYGHLDKFIYSTDNVIQTTKLFNGVNYYEKVKASEDVVFEMVDAGHILGAASVRIVVSEGGQEKRMLFSGDIGHKGQGLVNGFYEQKEFNPHYVVMESLYGGLEHPNRNEAVGKLFDLMNSVTARGGNLLIPSFSVQRTQEILFEVKKAKRNGTIPGKLEVFVDSPLANASTKIYEENWKYLNKEVQSLMSNNDNVFRFEGGYSTKNQRESMKLNNKKGIVIIAGAGMMTGGRILHHMNINLRDSRNALSIVGFQAKGTLGRLVEDGAKEIPLFDKSLKIKAQIERIHGFSGHADSSDLEYFYSLYKSDNLKKIFLVHAEEERFTNFRNILEFKHSERNAYVPSFKEEVEL